MKPYTYTIYKPGQLAVTTIVTEPGSPAPAKQPQREYQSVFEQLQAEQWDMRDSTEQDVKPLNNSILFAQISRQVN